MENKFNLINSKPSQDFIEWNELMSKNFDQDYYYEKSNPFIVWVEKTRIQIICKLIQEYINKNKSIDPIVVEAGCGEGQVLVEIESKIKTKKLIGIDPLNDWLEKARKKLNNNVQLIKGFAEDLPFDDCSIDIIVCTEVLEHIIDPKVVLTELKRVLKNDGLIIVSIPDESIITTLKNILGFFKIYEVLFPGLQKDNEWHLHHLDFKKFKGFIPEDLSIENVIKIPFGLFPLRYVITFKKEKMEEDKKTFQRVKEETFSKVSFF